MPGQSDPQERENRGRPGSPAGDSNNPSIRREHASLRRARGGQSQAIVRGFVLRLIRLLPLARPLRASSMSLDAIDYVMKVS